MTRWLLLIHHLPPKPDYLRVKVRRRLQRVGALGLKNSVYVLPKRDETLEDLEWVLSEIRDESGEAAILDAEFLHGPSDEELEARFRAERDEEYAALTKEARTLARTSASDADLSRLRRRIADIARLDFFGASKRGDAEQEIARLESAALRESALTPDEADRAATDGLPNKPSGAVWVTRAGVFVDRIASAWLIRRFIDPKASFRFVNDIRHSPNANELRFDMVGGEYTHEGDRCTFEVLVDRFAPDDPALDAIGKIVHDIDLKDEKFGSPEVAGLLAILSGLVRAHPDDAERLTIGGAIFDALYARLSAS
ncbi:MAG TPA: chromate resistance protein ChrB domain-containing protein [Gemmatimonadaceae bacterium]|nr:chromate resistance protein ChrB domain-containing protein [Gemmatimonadaceae bacterium]